MFTLVFKDQFCSQEGIIDFKFGAQELIKTTRHWIKRLLTLTKMGRSETQKRRLKKIREQERAQTEDQARMVTAGQPVQG